MVQIKWTMRALRDLHEIYRYISKGSLRYAQLEVEKIRISVYKLSYFPKLGRYLPEFHDFIYREIIIGNYRVIYRVDMRDHSVVVMSIMHGRRLLRNVP